MRTRSKALQLMLAALAIFITFPIAWRTIVRRHYERHIVEASAIPPQNTAIVFGAAVYRGGRLSRVLQDRMETAIRLYQAGSVDRILVSGDGSEAHHDEAGAMKSYAMARGLPPEVIEADDGGLRTYDTCYRARQLFGINNAVLVTQAFHLPRALFTCERLGIEVYGVAADKHPYRAARWYEFRETAASTVALLDVIWQRPPTPLGLEIPAREPSE